MIESSKVAAVGGIVRVANGSEFEKGRIVNIKTLRKLLPKFQIVEYLRAFIAVRTAWSKLNCLLIISGAFGMYRRRDLISAGGYAHDTVGEDMELTTSIHRALRENHRRYRVPFVPRPRSLDRGPRHLEGLEAPARPLAPGPYRHHTPAPQDALQPPLRDGWPDRDALLCPLRVHRPGRGDPGLRRLRHRAVARGPEPGVRHSLLPCRHWPGRPALDGGGLSGGASPRALPPVARPHRAYVIQRSGELRLPADEHPLEGDGHSILPAQKPILGSHGAQRLRRRKNFGA